MQLAKDLSQARVEKLSSIPLESSPPLDNKPHPELELSRRRALRE
jgi:hypothetical protein